MKPVVSVSVILPTRNRAPLLKRFLQSLHDQSILPAELVICDSSDGEDTLAVVNQARSDWNDERVVWKYLAASRVGLAPQRNQAVAASSQEFAWFLDDDVILEPGCLENLYLVLRDDVSIGGVTATIVNQAYSPPGRFTRALMRWFESGYERSTYAATCIGPGWTFLPDASRDLPAVTRAEWLIGCCSLYRKAALPVPAVPDHFESGAIGEDLAASLYVARFWSLVHARDARCFHDSQGGTHKRSIVALADQGLRNRHYILTNVMGRDTPGELFEFAVMLGFGLLSLLQRPTEWPTVYLTLVGYARGIWKLTFRSSSHV